MKKIFLIGILFLLSISNVYASTTDIGYITNNTSLIISNDRGVDIQLSNSTNNTQQIDIRTIIITINRSFEANKNYEIEISTPDAKLTNINKISTQGNGTTCRFMGISDMNIGYPKIYINCPSATNYVVLSLSNLSGNSITTSYNFRWNYTYLKSMTDDEIDLGPVISNQTQNTQDIINNNNTNTQDIINNQNQNTQDTINSQKVCKNLDKNYIEIDNYYLNSDGTNGVSPNYGITSYIDIDKETEIRVLSSFNSESASYCFYNTNKELISCTIIKNNILNTNLTIPNNASYFRSSIQKNQNKPTYEICRNGNQAISDELKEQNKTSKGILGKIGDLISYINPLSENFFVYKLIDLLEDLLKALFVPSSTFIKNWYDDFKAWFELKLGFIATPFTLFIDFIETFLNLEESNLIINIPQITVPNFENYVLIEARTFNWGELLNSKQEFRTLWTLYLDFIDVFLILNFLGLCETKYNRIFGGDTTPYEYYTTEETYNINDETGEATNHMLRQRTTRREKVK